MSRAGCFALGILGLALTVFALAPPAGSEASAVQDAKKTAWDGNRTTPAHLIPLRD